MHLITLPLVPDLVVMGTMLSHNVDFIAMSKKEFKGDHFYVGQGQGSMEMVVSTLDVLRIAYYTLDVGRERRDIYFPLLYPVVLFAREAYIEWGN